MDNNKDITTMIYDFFSRPLVLRVANKLLIWGTAIQIMFYLYIAVYYFREDLFGTFLKPHSVSIYNSLLQRAGDIGEHDISWMMIWIFMGYCRLKLKPTLLNILLSLLLGAFLVGVIEETWNLVFYFNVVILHQDTQTILGLSTFTELLVTKWYIFVATTAAIAVGLMCRVYRWFDKKRLLIAVGILLSYFTFWTIIGFPTTVSMDGITPYYHNSYTNLLEVLHWSIGCIVLMWAFEGDTNIREYINAFWIWYHK